MTHLEQRRARLSMRRGERIQRAVLGELAALGTLRPTKAPFSAKVLAIGILATPALVLLTGVWLLVGPGIWFLGILLIAIGVFLVPWPGRRDKSGLRREDAPQTFELLDGVSAMMGGKPVARLVITPDFNAFMAQDRDGPVIGIGALLWELAPNATKLAIVAHELAHQVNADPERDYLIKMALATLARWYDVVGPEVDGRYYSFFELLLAPFALVLEVVFEGLLRVVFAGHQRAEYLADLSAAQMAGTVEMQDALRLLMNGGLINEALLRFGGSRLPEGRDMLRAIAQEMAELPHERYLAARSMAESEGHTVDATHPPTEERIRFLSEAPQYPPRLVLTDEDIQRFDAELAPDLDRAGTTWTDYLERR